MKKKTITPDIQWILTYLRVQLCYFFPIKFESFREQYCISNRVLMQILQSKTCELTTPHEIKTPPYVIIFRMFIDSFTTKSATDAAHTRKYILHI